MLLKKIIRIVIVVVVSLLALCFIGLLIVSLRAETMVSNFLERKLPEHVQLEYSNLEVDLFEGTIAMGGVGINLLDRSSLNLHTEIDIDSIRLSDFGYKQFFFNNTISVEELRIQKPTIKHFADRVEKKDSTEPSGVVQLRRKIKIDAFKIMEGSLIVLKDNEKVAFNAQAFNLNLEDTKTGPDLIKEKIPISYGSHQVSVKAVFVDVDKFEQLEIGSVAFDNGNLKVADVTLRSKYSKKELSKHISKERDYIDLTVPEVTLDSVRFGYTRDTLFVAAGTGKIKNPTAEIYRDKLVADDLKHKKLYSRMLRELPIHVNFPKVEIFDGYLAYSEQVKRNVDEGKIIFEKMNGVLHNVANGPEGKGDTTISVHALLMGDAPIQLDWSFDTSNVNDFFTASGVIKDFHTRNLNKFLESNLGARANGTIHRLYFTISGNAISSSGDMKMKYQDFKFSVLRKNRSGVNKFLTAIGNIFVNDGSKGDEHGYRYGYIDVKRDPTKSFFNYLWLNVKEGTLNSITGKGKKRDK